MKLTTDGLAVGFVVGFLSFKFLRWCEARKDQVIFLGLDGKQILAVLVLIFMIFGMVYNFLDVGAPDPIRWMRYKSSHIAYIAQRWCGAAINPKEDSYRPCMDELQVELTKLAKVYGGERIFYNLVDNEN